MAGKRRNLVPVGDLARMGPAQAKVRIFCGRCRRPVPAQRRAVLLEDGWRLHNVCDCCGTRYPAPANVARRAASRRARRQLAAMEMAGQLVIPGVRR